MASPPPSPSSVANSSQNSTSKTSLLPKADSKPAVDGAAGDGMLDFVDKKQAVDNGGLADALEVKPKFQESSLDIDNPEIINKFKKYEADYIRLLMGKYFSKDPCGANIYSQKLMVEDETIRSSRFPATQAYVDPVRVFEDQRSNGSPTAETPTGISNGKQQAPKKSS